MTINELKAELDKLGINPANYSLTGDLNSNAIILYPNYRQTEVFYLDEKGNREKERTFSSILEACDYVYQLFLEAKEVERRFGIKTLK
jgi:hypothetical protein